ncbi:tRNA-uridine aminocarboxypropyltransferase [Thalassotalea sediminis]|uniref:tRNA-uridine aminocarboxypropyltransferase n=1 Tax=Thalassotalea sediminis TaxID=1759089 RepID=UPI0025744A9A|nr:DTW domain-containing protein [Thalassotalea sediminis]
MHAVHQLYFSRKAISTKPFNARGKGVIRCELCQVAKVNCICQLCVSRVTASAFMLLMHDSEVLKPSNTGRLIADVVKETYAFQWQRTDVDANLLTLLHDIQYQPYVVFPEEYVTSNIPVHHSVPSGLSNKKPLFILLDGSWREAKKMYRKSPYLERLPVISLTQSVLHELKFDSKYTLRKAEKDFQLSTAEIATLLLASNAEYEVAEQLSLWSRLFEFRYRKSVCQRNLIDPCIESEYQTFLNKAQNRIAEEKFGN